MTSISDILAGSADEKLSVGAWGREMFAKVDDTLANFPVIRMEIVHPSGAVRTREYAGNYVDRVGMPTTEELEFYLREDGHMHLANHGRQIVITDYRGRRWYYDAGCGIVDDYKCFYTQSELAQKEAYELHMVKVMGKIRMRKEQAEVVKYVAAGSPLPARNVLKPDYAKTEEERAVALQRNVELSDGHTIYMPRERVAKPNFLPEITDLPKRGRDRAARAKILANLNGATAVEQVATSTQPAVNTTAVKFETYIDEDGFKVTRPVK